MSQILVGPRKSPSSRRAWIEISSASNQLRYATVALLAEGVDRNTRNQSCTSWLHVALLAEGVDRNCGLGSALVK